MLTNRFKTDYSLKSDCNRLRQRHRDYWQHKTLSYPLLHIKSQNNAYNGQMYIDKNKDRKELESDINWHIDHCRKQIDNYEFLFDSMPIAPVMFGRDITNMGVLTGHDFSIHEETEFIAFNNDPDFLFGSTLEFNTESPFVQRALAIYQGVKKSINLKACLNPPTTADAMTTIAMIMGVDNFLRSLVKSPLQVKQKALELNRIFYQFYEYIYGYLLQWGYGESASWFPVFAEGKFDSVRSDVSVMLSGKMFNELALPVTEDACSYLNFTMFNLDSVRLIRFLEPLSTIRNLNGVYWNIEPWLYNLLEYLPVLKKIREMGLLLALPCKSIEDAKLIVNKLGKSGIILEFPVFLDRYQAVAVGEEIIEFCSRCLY